MKKYFLDGDTLIILEDGELREAELLGTVEDEEEEVVPVKKGKRVQLCKVCNKPGHRAKTCSKNGTKKHSGMEDLPDDDSEDSLIEEIKRMWVEENMSSLAVCEQLSISLGKFNRIIQKYNIVKA